VTDTKAVKVFDSMERSGRPLTPQEIADGYRHATIVNNCGCQTCVTQRERREGDDEKRKGPKA
jgi:hypothetical protein